MDEINYPWHLAPDWAQWALVTPEGEARWFHAKPSLDDDGTEFPYICDWEDLPYTPIRNWTPPENIDWKQSLEKRPEQ